MSDSVAAQRQFVRKQCKRKLRPGEQWFVVSNEWWRRWTTYTSADARKSDDTPPAPGPIDNSDVMDPRSEGDVAYDRVEGMDFHLVPQEAWDELKKAYDVLHGHEMARSVIQQGSGTARVTNIELFPQRSQVYRADSEGDPRGNPVPMTFRRTLSPEEVLEAAKKATQVHEADGRLWVGEAKERVEDVVWQRADSELEEALGTPNLLLLVEVPRADGKFPRDAKQERELHDLRASLGVGDRCDAQDKFGDWFHAVAVEVRKGMDVEEAKELDSRWDEATDVDWEGEEGVDVLRMHFRGWAPKFDEFITRSSPRLQPLYSRVPAWRSRLRVGDVVEVKHTPERRKEEWVPARVERVVPRGYEPTEEDDQWDPKTLRTLIVVRTEPHQSRTALSADSEQLVAAGTHTKAGKRAAALAGAGSGAATGAGSRTHFGWVPGRPLSPGVVGMPNQGNTCFMNSMLQCLLATKPLTDFFSRGHYLRDLNPDNPLSMGGDLARAYAAFVDDAWRGSHCVITPHTIKSLIARRAPQFHGFQQHDSQEFMSFLLDGLHEDLNRVREKPLTNSVEGDGRPDAEVAREAWEVYLQRNRSHIVDVFQGQLKSHLTCPITRHVSVTFDPFMTLSLPIPSQSWLASSTVFTFYPVGGVRPVLCRHRASMQTSRVNFGDVLNWTASTFGCRPRDLVIAQSVDNLPVFQRSDRTRNTVGKSDAILIYQLRAPEGGDAADKGRASAHTHSNGGTDGAAARPEKEQEEDDGVRGSSKDREEEEEEEEELLHPIPVIHAFPGPKGKYYQSAPRYKKRGLMSPFSRDKRMDDATPGLPLMTVLRGDRVTNRQAHEAALSVVRRLVRGGGEKEKEGELRVDTAPYRLRRGDPTSEDVAHMPVVPLDDGPFTLPAPLEEAVPPNRGGDKKELLTLDALVIEWPKTFDECFDRKEAKLANAHQSYNDSSAEATTVTLEGCIEKFREVEQLGEDDMWYSPKAKKHVRAWKAMDLWRLPEVLIIHLKRFRYRARRHGITMVEREKVSDKVEFPVHNLDLTKLQLDPDAPRPVYDLFAVSNHHGGYGAGHYTAFAKSRQGNWIRFDDARVTPASESAVVTRDAYVLFYQRRTAAPRGQMPERAVDGDGNLVPVGRPKLNDAAEAQDEMEDASERVRGRFGGGKLAAGPPHHGKDQEVWSKGKSGQPPTLSRESTNSDHFDG